MSRIIVGVVMLLMGVVASAQTIYQSTDKNGNPIFTDQPQSNAKAVELKSINTTPAVTPTGRTEPEAAVFKGYNKVAVSVPSTIPNGLAPTNIGIVVQPQLQPGHTWQLLMDGKQLAQGQEGSTTLDQIARGPHQFLLQVVDGQGNIVGSSTPTDVFVYWPSKNR